MKLINGIFKILVLCIAFNCMVSSVYAADDDKSAIKRRDLKPDTTLRGAELEKSEHVANPQKRPSLPSDGINKDASGFNKGKQPSRDVTPTNDATNGNPADHSPTDAGESYRSKTPQ